MLKGPVAFPTSPVWEYPRHYMMAISFLSKRTQARTRQQLQNMVCASICHWSRKDQVCRLLLPLTGIFWECKKQLSRSIVLCLSLNSPSTVRLYWALRNHCQMPWLLKITLKKNKISQKNSPCLKWNPHVRKDQPSSVSQHPPSATNPTQPIWGKQSVTINC